MRFLNKRGISPLIATVLLIGFTVALAAVVITWGTGFVQKVTSGTEQKTDKAIICTSDLNFEIESVKCPNKITLDNVGEVNIKKFNLRFFSANDDLLGIQNLDKLDKYQLKQFTLSPDMPASTNKVEVFAVVDLDGQEITCSENSR